MVGKTKQLELNKPTVRKMGRMKLPSRTESIVNVTVKTGSPLVGMTNKCEIQKGVIIAAPLTRVVDGYAITSVLNTNDTEVNVQEHVGLEEVDLNWERDSCTEFESQDRRKIFRPK
jgi:propanediol utilization protein